MITRGTYCSRCLIGDLDNITENLDERHLFLIYLDHVYKRVVDSLVNSADMFMRTKQHNFYKFWWSQELDVIKNNAI